MNTQINITENGTTTLATAGKYCDRNIDVNVDVDNIADVVQGTIEGAYVSDKVTSVKTFAFATCGNLTSVSLPNCTSISGSAFRDCSSLESVNLPSCVSFVNGIGTGYFFDGASQLKSINIPNLTTIKTGTRSFGGCKLLEEINAPNLTSLATTVSMFANDSQLKKVCFPKLGGATINANTFNYCSRLDALILGGNELNPLENINAFNSTPIKSGKGYVYVPDDLVDTYKTATNWATLADQIKPISELEE